MGITKRIIRALLTSLTEEERARVLADFAPRPNPTLQLDIRIDQEQRQQDFAAIHDSPWFVELQTNAASMRIEMSS